MKKFLQTLFSFCSLFLCALCFWGLLKTGHYLRILYKEFTPRKSTQIIAITDSHGLCALDEDVYAELQKFCSHGLANWQILARLCVVLQLNDSDVKVALFTLSPHNLSIGNVLSRRREAGRFVIPALKKIGFDSFLPFICVMGNSFNKFDVRFVEPKSNLIKQSLWGVKSEDVLLRRTLWRHYAEVEQNVSDIYYDECVDVYDIIITLCKTKGIRPIFLSTPLHPLYLENMPKSAEDRMVKIFKWLDEKGIQYYDDRSVFTDSRLFIDSDHLSQKGSEVYSLLLKKRLSNCLN